MSCFSKPQIARRCQRASRIEHRASRTAFTLIEAMTAVLLLAFIGSSVWIVLERCMISAADSTQRMRAFEIARDNLEKLLGSASVEIMTDFGISEKFPDIRWQTTIEDFYEPISSRMWVRAVASAEYTDTAGETQSVELTHWLTDLTDEQMQQLAASKAVQEKQLEQFTIETEELAAQYAGVNVQTIREWVKNGMPVGSEGAFLKPWLELYGLTDGNPTELDKRELIDRYPGLGSPKQFKGRPGEAPGTEERPSPPADWVPPRLPE